MIKKISDLFLESKTKENGADHFVNNLEVQKVLLIKDEK